MIKRLSMAAIMNAGIFAPASCATNLGEFASNSTMAILCPLPFQSELL
jgi:hypothetical protein